MTIEEFRPEHAAAFEALNRAWLGPALGLYERAGFRYETPPATNPYATADVYMVLDVKP